MSTGTVNRWRESALSVCAIVVVLALLWHCKPSLFGRSSSDGGVPGLFGSSAVGDGEPYLDNCERDGDSEDEEEEETEYPTILSMPICADLSDSIRTLRVARNDLLRVAIDGDAQAILAASTEYREALQEVQNDLTTLKMRVVPNDFSGASQELLGFFEAGDRQTIMPFELGHLKQDILQ